MIIQYLQTSLSYLPWKSKLWLGTIAIPVKRLFNSPNSAENHFLALEPVYKSNLSENNCRNHSQSWPTSLERCRSLSMVITGLKRQKARQDKTRLCCAMLCHCTPFSKSRVRKRKRWVTIHLSSSSSSSWQAPVRVDKALVVWEGRKEWRMGESQRKREKKWEAKHERKKEIHNKSQAKGDWQPWWHLLTLLLSRRHCLDILLVGCCFSKKTFDFIFEAKWALRCRCHRVQLLTRFVSWRKREEETEKAATAAAAAAVWNPPRVNSGHALLTPHQKTDLITENWKQKRKKVFSWQCWQYCPKYSSKSSLDNVENFLIAVSGGKKNNDCHYTFVFHAATTRVWSPVAAAAAAAHLATNFWMDIPS